MRACVACISHRRVNTETFCDEAYLRDKYLSTYGDIIHPIHDEILWDEVPGDVLQSQILKRLSSLQRLGGGKLVRLFLELVSLKGHAP